MKVMILVTHLLGTGHLARALTLARAFGAAGDEVTVLSGGLPVNHFDTDGQTLIQLPAIRSNGVEFTTLLDAQGQVVDAAYMAARCRVLLAALRHIGPDVLITELFPFGRRILHQEFHALLEAAQALASPPVILSSIRDILAPPSKPAKVQFADDMITQFYDGVLVHSDPALIPLDRSWPVSGMLENRLRYTGFVAPTPPPPSAPNHEILVSAGGGGVGDRIFEAACEAARLTPDLHWRCLVGGAAERIPPLAARAPANMICEAPRADFRTLLNGAAASVSMCGYNTAMDVLQTGVPAVFVPFDDGGEVEQGLRAQALSALPGIAVVRQDTLDSATLLQGLDQVRSAPRRGPQTDYMDGAIHTVQIVRDICQKRVR
ncbi:glycosyltransferase [uncultured Tateyamaria sp.]|uniref:glycosyltransferase family protein n=1 Tax=uncultured Tateyamaria sp. TaxID=455651 RepID=UPI002604360D|nr:glycosyltransferase [uncultured Tateyamaria sp.]